MLRSPLIDLPLPLETSGTNLSSSNLQYHGVSRGIIEHRLLVNPSSKPKKQKLCKMLDEKVTVAMLEVRRLLDVGFIREVQYPSWLANVVMVKKKNDKWRMCTKLTDHNKSCPKDDFPLIRIDKVVDSAAWCKTMTLLDCFSR
jgi:hypothetical protein